MRTSATKTTGSVVMPLLIVGLIVVIGVLSFNLYRVMTGTGEVQLTSGATARLSVVSGEVAGFLPATSQWKVLPAPGSSLAAGERVRTGEDGNAFLTFDDGTRVDMLPGSEIALVALENGVKEKSAEVLLVRGSAVVDRRSAMGMFAFLTPYTRVAQAGSLYATLMDAETDIALTMNLAGEMVVEVVDPKIAKVTVLKELPLAAGETAELTEKWVNLARLGGEVKTRATLDSEKGLAVYGAAMARMSAGQLAPVPAVVTPAGTATTGMEGVTPVVVPAEAGVPGASATGVPATTTGAVTPAVVGGVSVTTGGGRIVTSSDTVEVKGTVPAGTASVEVTHGGVPYVLKGYVAGKTEWMYRAGVKLGNMTEGVNTYTVVAVSAEGVRSSPQSFTITYEKKAATTTEVPVVSPAATPAATPAVSGGAAAGGAGVPTVGATVGGGVVTVTSPASGAVVTTAPVRITGTVPKGTVSVAVTAVSAGSLPYTLTSFKEGATTWSYNADAKYGNLVVGVNTFKIVATLADGTVVSGSVSITYAPPAESAGAGAAAEGNLP